MLNAKSLSLYSSLEHQQEPNSILALRKCIYLHLDLTLGGTIILFDISRIQFVQSKREQL